MRPWAAKVGRRAFVLLMLAGSLLITAGSLAYFDPETLPPFVIEKLPLRFEALWMLSLKVHVVCAALSLPLCVALITRTLQRRPAWHRWLGRAAGAIVLAGLVPSGIVLSFQAKGGTSVTVGFLVSAAIVLVAMVYGVMAARRGELRRHGYCMRHVVGQMSVAVSSRALIVALDMAGVDPDKAYVIALWGPVLGTILLVELISRPFSFNSFSPFTRIKAHVSSSPRLVHARAFARAFARVGR
jgi:hypothetical protein